MPSWWNAIGTPTTPVSPYRTTSRWSPVKYEAGDFYIPGVAERLQRLKFGGRDGDDDSLLGFADPDLQGRKPGYLSGTTERSTSTPRSSPISPTEEESRWRHNR